ncbi:MAG: PA14 domain-containing protein [Pseudomonadota bacterium]
MDEEEYLPTESSEADAKKDVARNVAKSSDNIQEDPSRATLHYGDETRPELGGEGGIQASGLATEDPALEIETPQAEVADPASSDQPTGSFSQPVSAAAATVRDPDAPDMPDNETRPESIAFDQPASPDFTVEQTASVSAATVSTPEIDVQPGIERAEGPGNVAPTDIRLDGAQVTENADGAVIGRLSVVDANGSDTHSFTLSDDRFEVVDGEVRLRPGVTLDHEEAATIQLDVTATDRGGLSVTETFEVAVLNVNEGPTAVTLDARAIAENASGAVVGRLTTIDPDAGDTHSYSLSDDRFEVVDGEVRLKPDVALDFEEASAISVEVTATDSGGRSIAQTFEVSVTNENEGPDSVSLDASPVAENQAGAVVGRLSVFDQDEGDTHQYAVSDDRFEVVDGEVRLKPGVALDHEEAASITLDVTATDSGGLSVTESFDIAVSDVNEGPSSVSLETSGISENAQGAVVGRLNTIDPDAGDSHTYSVSDDRFEVLDGEVRLKPGIALDHEEAASITLDVTATDSGGLSVSESFEISVADVNEAPESIELEGNTLIAGRDGAVVGKIAGADPDAGDTLSYTVSDDRFEVVDGEVRLKPDTAVSPEEQGLDLVVTATDTSGLSVSETFSLNVFDPPVISVDSGFTADYFDVDGRLREISDIDWDADPTHSEITQDINYAKSKGSFWEGGDTDTFGVRVNGNINVEDEGTFTFHLGGDDGAMLFVNGAPVIDNDGLHGFRTRSGEIELPEGNHHIEVLYFENTGHAGLRLEWEGPGIDGRQLVDAPADGAAIGIEGIATPLDLEVGNVGENAVYRMDGVPEGTVVQSGDTVLTAGEEGSIDLTGVDLADLSITPPIGSADTFEPHLTIAQPGPDGESIEVSQPIDIDVTPAHLTPHDVDMFGGFRASYYDVDHRLSRMDQIDWDSEPTHEEIVADVNYENSRESFWEGGSKDTFGARIEGDIEVSEGGTYKFFLGGDDGAMLYINGEPVIDNDGLHGFRTRNGEIELEPGDHSIEVFYFENTGRAGLKLEWQGPDTDGRELVTAKPDLDIEQNGSTQVALDIGNPDAVETVMINGLPADTVLFLGDETFVTDGGPLDVSGHDLSMMEISPPAGFAGTIEGDVSTLSRGFNGQMTNGGTTFEISVGEDAMAQSLTLDADSSVLMMEEAQSTTDLAAWTQNEPPENENENDPDDVMSEEISEFQISETSEDQIDTYERYDW